MWSNYICFLYIFLTFNPLSDTRFTHIFSLSIGFLLILFTGSFVLQKLFSLMSHIKPFWYCCFWVWCLVQEITVQITVKVLFSYVFFYEFYSFNLMFKSLTHFRSLFERPSFPHWVFWAPFPDTSSFLLFSFFPFRD